MGQNVSVRKKYVTHGRLRPYDMTTEVPYSNL